MSIPEFEKPITAVSFSLYNQWLVTGNQDGNTFLWKMNDLNSAPLVLHNPEDSVRNAIITYQGDWLITSGEKKEIYLWLLPN